MNILPVFNNAPHILLIRKAMKAFLYITDHRFLRHIYDN